MPNPAVEPTGQTEALASNDENQRKVAERLADAQTKIDNGTATDHDREMVLAFNTGAEAAEDRLDPSTISDIVNVDDYGRGHVSGSKSSQNDADGRSNNGQFISNSNMEVIAANADLIRGNLPSVEPSRMPTPEATLEPIPTPSIQSDIDPSDPMHPGYSGLASASPAAEPTPAPVPEPEPEPEPLLTGFTAGKVKGALQAVAEKGTHVVEEEKVENSRLGIFRRFAKNMKFMTLFKDETVRRRGVEILGNMRKTPPPLTPEELSVAVKDANSAYADADNQLILDMVNDPTIRRGSQDVVIEGSGEEDEHPAVARVRQGISDALLTYLQDTRDPNLSPEELQERTQAYQDQVRTFIDGVMEENPDFNQEALSVMSDSSLELANEARVFIGHENGLDALKKQLQTMKISLGEIQIGPNAEYNTEYLERTLDRMKGRHVDTMLARASFSVGTFVLSGAMAHGISEFSKQTAARSGAKYGGAIAGGILFGPVGVGVGLAASSLASAMFARKLAIDQGRKTIAHVGVEQGDSAATAKSELMTRLSLSTLDYSDIDRVYNESTIDEEQPDGTTKRVLKPDLSTEEALCVIQVIGDARTRLSVEDNSTPRVNLLSSQTPASYLTERVSALRSLSSMEALLEGKVYEVPTGELNDDGQPITSSVEVDDLLSNAAATAATEIRSDLEATQLMRDQYLKTEGRKAALIGGVASALGGVSAFGLTELVSHGIAPSVIEGLGLKSGNGEATQRAAEAGVNRAREALSSNSGNVTAHFNTINGSKVEVLQGGKNVMVETPTGRHMEIPLNNKGEVSSKDLLELKRHGVNVEQTSTTALEAKQVSVDTAFDKLGGKPMDVSTWLGNNTVGSDGTELGTHLGIGGQNQIIIEQNAGTAFEGSQRFDLSQMASEGKLNAYLVNNGKTVVVPMSVGPNGNMYAAIPADSPLRSMFAQQSNGWWAYQGSEWHIGIATADPNKFDSVSTLLGPGSVRTVTEQVPVSSTNLNFDFVNPNPVGDRETEFILGGLVPTPDGGLLYEKPAEAEDKETVNNVSPPSAAPPTAEEEIPEESGTPGDGSAVPTTAPPAANPPGEQVRERTGMVGNTLWPSTGGGWTTNTTSSNSAGAVNTFMVEGSSTRTQAPVIPDEEAEAERRLFDNPADTEFFDSLVDNEVPTIEESELGESEPSSSGTAQGGGTTTTTSSTGSPSGDTTTSGEEAVSIYGYGGLIDQWATAKNSNDAGAAEAIENLVRKRMVDNNLSKVHIDGLMKRIRPYVEQRRIALKKARSL